jgi:WD40 repeat protein
LSGVRALEPLWSQRLNDCIISAAFSSDGRYLAAAEISGKLVVFDARLGQRLREIPAHGFGITTISWRPGASELATAGQDGKARLWSAATGGKLAELNCGAEWVEKLQFAPSGQYLATAAGKKLRLWSPTGELLLSAPDHTSTIADLEWMPGTARFPGEVLAYCGYGGLVFLRPGQAQSYKSFEYKGSMLKIRWSPDACFIGTGNQDASIQFFVLPEGVDGPSRDLVMWGYRSKILDMAWDPQSRYLATGGSSTIIIWNCGGKGPAGSKPDMLDFHMRLISELAWQTSGPLLASGCEEGLLALWRPGKGSKPLATDHLGAAISQIQWAPGDQSFLAASEDGSLNLYEIERFK